MSTTTQQPAQSAQKPPQAASFRQVLKNRHFVLLWLAQLISLTILNAANYGIIVLVNDATHSVLMAGLAIIAFTLPALPFSALAGVVVDHLNKRLVLWVSNALRAATTLLLVISLLSNRSNLWPLYVLTFVTSLIGQFFTPAESASIPLLVGERDIMVALSLFNITMTLAQAIGFLLLGSIVSQIFPPFTLNIGFTLLHVHSIDMLFVLVTFFYLVCAGLILCIPNRAFEETRVAAKVKEVRHRASTAITELWREISDGWRYVRHDRVLFFAVLQLSIVGNIMLLIGELAGAFVQQVLHRPAADMALILAPAAIGLVATSIILPNIANRVDKLRLTVIGIIVLAIGFILLPANQWLAQRLNPASSASSPYLLWTTIALVLILGAAMACINIPTQTLMQEHTASEVRGRVFSLQFMVYNTGSIPILLFAGLFAQFIGINWLILLIAGSMLLFCWWGIRYVRPAKNIDYPLPAPQNDE